MTIVQHYEKLKDELNKTKMVVVESQNGNNVREVKAIKQLAFDLGLSISEKRDSFQLQVTRDFGRKLNGTKTINFTVYSVKAALK